MNSTTIRDYLRHTDMDEAQAEALSRIFAEMATKNDLLVLEERVAGQMAHLKADLTWRMIAIIGFFGTVITILNAFVR